MEVISGTSVPLVLRIQGLVRGGSISLDGTGGGGKGVRVGVLRSWKTWVVWAFVGPSPL